MPTRRSGVATVLAMAADGPLRARDLDKASIPRAYLRRLCDRGLLEQVDRGLYRRRNLPASELGSLAEVCARAPAAIVCLLSALQLHGMTAEMPHAVWIMLDRHAQTPRFRTPSLEVVRASGNARTHGTEVRTIEGVEVNVTSPAKTVADCFRFRRHIGLEVALGALRDYLRRPRRSLDALVAAAHADRIYSVLRPYLEALA